MEVWGGWGAGVTLWGGDSGEAPFFFLKMLVLWCCVEVLCVTCGGAGGAGGAGEAAVEDAGGILNY